MITKNENVSLLAISTGLKRHCKKMISQLQEDHMYVDMISIRDNRENTNTQNTNLIPLCIMGSRIKSIEDNNCYYEELGDFLECLIDRALMYLIPFISTHRLRTSIDIIIDTTNPLDSPSILNIYLEKCVSNYFLTSKNIQRFLKHMAMYYPHLTDLTIKTTAKHNSVRSIGFKLRLDLSTPGMNKLLKQLLQLDPDEFLKNTNQQQIYAHWISLLSAMNNQCKDKPFHSERTFSLLNGQVKQLNESYVFHNIHL